MYTPACKNGKGRVHGLEADLVNLLPPEGVRKVGSSHLPPKPDLAGQASSCP